MNRLSRLLSLFLLAFAASTLPQSAHATTLNLTFTDNAGFNQGTGSFTILFPPPSSGITTYTTAHASGIYELTQFDVTPNGFGSFGLGDATGDVSVTFYAGNLSAISYNGSRSTTTTKGRTYTESLSINGLGFQVTDGLSLVRGTVALVIPDQPNPTPTPADPSPVTPTPTTPTAVTPEPSSLLLLGTGLASLAGVARRHFPSPSVNLLGKSYSVMATRSSSNSTTVFTKVRNPR